MIPEEIQKQINEAMLKMGNKLVQTGFATHFSLSSPTGICPIQLTPSGLFLLQSFRSIFDSSVDSLGNLNGIEVMAAIQLLFSSGTISSN